ncbi:SRPBCC family protein [Variovorax beijingensis]|uniref:SRPBCC family protein n=1 Tax=Variovorax beijingensis TaxID=2496117 RepID=UPI003F69FE40
MTKSQLGTLLEPGTLRMERTLPASVERVWAYFVDPDKRAAWLAGGTMAEEPGSVFELRFDHTRLSGEVAPERFSACRSPILQKSRVVEFEPLKRLTISWGSENATASQVSFEFTQEGDATHLVLTHRRLPDRKETLSVSSGWHAHLDVLDDLLHGRKPRGFWTNHAALEKAYDERLAA